MNPFDTEDILVDETHVLLEHDGGRWLLWVANHRPSTLLPDKRFFIELDPIDLFRLCLPALGATQVHVSELGEPVVADPNRHAIRMAIARHYFTAADRVALAIHIAAHAPRWCYSVMHGSLVAAKVFAGISSSFLEGAQVAGRSILATIRPT